ncbi:zinc metalloproteinase nas-14-like [Panulirus ornatus]|uniref:zinc metalloproteinase nas-14-like n=1 Tax=Panulirus ornatus TaxID=150431 RepID=UPI003A873E5B
MSYKVAIYLSVCFLSCMCAVGGNWAKVSLSAKSADQQSSMVERPTTSSSLPRTAGRSETSVPEASETHIVGEVPFLHWDFHGDAFDEAEDPVRRPMARILSKRWPNNTIPIGFDVHFPQEYRPKVYETMDTFNKATCLKFVNATDASTYYVRVTNKLMACSAVTGYRKGKRSSQMANFHKRCFKKKGVIFHELMHTIGFPHQQTRSDRDEYVKIHVENIDPKHLRNFKKMKGKNAHLITVGIPYDYNSLMHYPINGFSNGKGPTMTILKPHAGFVGQDDEPSRSDIASINRLYECWDHYLGDDIPDAVPYEEFYAAYMAPAPNISSTVQQWSDKMTKRNTSVNQTTPAPGDEISSVNKPSDPVKDKEEERNYQATISRIEKPATEHDSLILWIMELKKVNESNRQEIDNLAMRT